MSTPIAYRNRGLRFAGGVGLQLVANSLANPAAAPFTAGGTPTQIAVRWRAQSINTVAAVICSFGSTRGWGMWENYVGGLPKVGFCLDNAGATAGRYVCSVPRPLTMYDGYFSYDSSMQGVGIPPQFNINDVAQTVTESGTNTLTLPADTAADKSGQLWCALGSSQNVMDSVCQTAARAAVMGAASEWSSGAAINPFIGDFVYLAIWIQGVLVVELGLNEMTGRPVDLSGNITDPRWITSGGVQGAGVTNPPAGVEWKSFDGMWRNRPPRPRCLMGVR